MSHRNFYSHSSQSVPSLHQKPDRGGRPIPTKAATHSGPWHHMTGTYAWVVEQDFVKLDKHGRNTEQWLQEQQTRLPEGTARQEIGERVRRRMWEDMMCKYEAEAERWMRHEEEMRRTAIEREKRRERIVREDLRREREAAQQCRSRPEPFPRPSEHTRREDQQQGQQRTQNPAQQYPQQRYNEKPKTDKTLLDSWKRYEDCWNNLSLSSDRLAFTNIPWPVAATPRAPDHLSLSAIAEFLLSPLHSQNLSRKDRIRNAQLRWHPDRFQRLMQRVDEADKQQVAEGVGIVARSLNELMSREKQR